MEIFKYEPINLERPSLRLLRLLRGEVPDDIECELFQAYLDGDDLIPYHAVSYTWGRTEKTSAVALNGKTHGVTENLYLALQYLRRREIDRVLWVDAICIDQSNEREQGHQVQQMGKIYSRAEEVIFWLGPATYEIKVLMDSLSKLNHKSLETAWRNLDLTDGHWQNLWVSVKSDLMRQYPGLTTLQRKGLESLLSRPWFRRVWILQEVANAKRAVVCSGDWSVPAHIFVISPLLLQISPEPHSQAVLDIMPGPGRRNSWWSEKRGIYTLLQKFSKSEASDPRDMVYALLGISSDAFDADNLRPDYAKNIQQVIHDTVAFIFGPSTASYKTIEDFLQSPCSKEEPSFSEITKTCSSSRIADYLKHHRERAKVTEAVVEAAAANSSSGKDVMKFLLQQRGSEVKITEAVAKAAAANSSGKDVMELLLDQRGPEVKITEAVVEAAAKNSSGKDVIELLLQQRRSEVKITEAVVAAAAANSSGKGVIRLLLRQDRSEVKITEGLVINLARSFSADHMDLLLRERGSDFKITEAVVEAAAANSSGKDVMELLLQRRGVGAKITKELVINRRSPFSVYHMDLLLRERGSDFKITEAVVEAAAANSSGKDVMELLLQRRGSEIEIIGVVVEAVAASWGGFDVIELLLQQRGFDFKITEAVVEAAAANSSGKDVMDLLLQHRGFDFKITEAVVEAAAANLRGFDVIDLLQQRGSDFKITEAVVEAAAANSSGKDVIELLLQRRGSEIKITEAVVEAAAANSSGKDVMDLLLRERGSDFKITEAVVEAAAANSRGKDVIELLLQRRGSEIKITEAVVEAAAANLSSGKDVIELLVQKRGAEVKITEAWRKLQLENQEIPNIGSSRSN